MGIFRFQRCLYHLTVYAGDLPPSPEVAPLQINVLPLEPQHFSPPQTGSQFQVVELKHTALSGLPQEGLELFHRQGLHFSVLHFRQSAALRWVGEDDSLLLGQL